MTANPLRDLPSVDALLRTGAGKALVVADPARRFYPPAAARLGVDLRRTIVIRPRDPRYTLAAVTHSLRCAAVGAVLGAFDNLPTFDFRRLQLAAELGGGIGFLLRPATALRVPSFADVRLRVALRAPHGRTHLRAGIAASRRARSDAASMRSDDRPLRRAVGNNWGACRMSLRIVS